MWIPIRINKGFLFVKNDSYDMVMPLDAAGAYVLAFVFSKVIEEAPNEKNVEDLFKKAWAAKRQWAKKLTSALLYIFV